MLLLFASMRPPEFTGGNNDLKIFFPSMFFSASMRPPEFTGGNTLEAIPLFVFTVYASMRPPEFTGGNMARQQTQCSADVLQ